MPPQVALHNNYPQVEKYYASKVVFSIGLSKKTTLGNNDILIDLKFQNLTDINFKLVDLFDDPDIDFALNFTSGKGDIGVLGPQIVDFNAGKIFSYKVTGAKNNCQNA